MGWGLRAGDGKFARGVGTGKATIIILLYRVPTTGERGTLLIVQGGLFRAVLHGCAVAAAGVGDLAAITIGDALPGLTCFVVIALAAVAAAAIAAAVLVGAFGGALVAIPVVVLERSAIEVGPKKPVVAGSIPDHA